MLHKYNAKYHVYEGKIIFYPSIFCCLPRSRSRGISLSKDAYPVLSLATLRHFSRGDAMAFPSRQRDLIFPALPGSSLGFPPRWHSQSSSARRWPRGILVLWVWRNSNSTLNSSQMTELLNLLMALSPDTLWRKPIPVVYNLILSVTITAHDCRWEQEYWSANKIDSFTFSSLSQQCLQHCRLCTNPFAKLHLFLFSLVNKNPTSWGDNSFQTHSGHSRQLRTTAPELEVLILIPATSHSTANCPSASWRSSFV